MASLGFFIFGYALMFGNGNALFGTSGWCLIGAKSGVIQNIEAGKTLWGTPAFEKKEELRMISMRRRLPDMAKQMKLIIKRIEKLEAAEDNKE